MQVETATTSWWVLRTIVAKAEKKSVFGSGESRNNGYFGHDLNFGCQNIVFACVFMNTSHPLNKVAFNALRIRSTPIELFPNLIFWLLNYPAYLLNYHPFLPLSMPNKASTGLLMASKMK